MDENEIITAIETYIGDEQPKLRSHIAEVLYSMDERGLWIDQVDSVSAEQCLLCWRIVEALRKKAFPKALRP